MINFIRSDLKWRSHRGRPNKKKKKKKKKKNNNNNNNNNTRTATYKNNKMSSDMRPEPSYDPRGQAIQRYRDDELLYNRTYE